MKRIGLNPLKSGLSCNMNKVTKEERLVVSIPLNRVFHVTVTVVSKRAYFRAFLQVVVFLKKTLFIKSTVFQKSNP